MPLVNSAFALIVAYWSPYATVSSEKEYIPVEAAIELLTRRAEEKIDDYEEDEEWEDEE